MTPDLPLLGVLDFVRRQTPDSPWAHFDGGWDELVALCETHWQAGAPSPHNPQVWVVPMPAALYPRFYTATVALQPGMPLKATFEPRMPGEEPVLQVSVCGGEKQNARCVEIICYSHAVLAQDGDAPEPQTARYYIVSLNAYPQSRPEPMRPVTMARNLLNLSGGTRPEVPYSPEEFAHAILYWAQHARLAP
ncbi:MAG: DUF3228 family protein [Candidatus Melainabacteria bacterium]